jgi:sec-independent protein translocase protein TatA
MFANLTGWHFLILALIVLLIFGATRLPALARSVGQSAKILKAEMKEITPEAGPAEAQADRAATPVATSTSK